MNNNYKSKNNNDKSINNNDFLFIELCNLFQTEAPIYEKLFCPMLVLRKGILQMSSEQ